MIVIQVWDWEACTHIQLHTCNNALAIIATLIIINIITSECKVHEGTWV